MVLSVQNGSRTLVLPLEERSGSLQLMSELASSTCVWSFQRAVFSGLFMLDRSHWTKREGAMSLKLSRRRSSSRHLLTTKSTLLNLSTRMSKSILLRNWNALASSVIHQSSISTSISRGLSSVFKMVILSTRIYATTRLFCHSCLSPWLPLLRTEDKRSILHPKRSMSPRSSSQTRLLNGRRSANWTSVL